MVYRETVNWPEVREENVLAQVVGGEAREQVMLSSHDNVAPVESVDVDPLRGLSQDQKVYRAGTVVAKITEDVGGENESGKWGPYDPSASDDGRDAKIAAEASTGSEGADTAIRYRARVPGPLGHQISIELDDAGADESLAVSVNNGTEVVVTLETNGGGDIQSTAQEVIDAINAHTEASQLMVAENQGDSDGSGTVSAEAAQNLSGAKASVDVGVIPVDVNVEFGDVQAGVYTRNCIFDADRLRGYSGEESNLDLAFRAQNCEAINTADVSA
ncbi:MAG: hypothetical protein ACOC5M_00265 [Chloroflexota bacterium]